MHKRQPVLIMVEGRRSPQIAKSKTEASQKLGVSRTKLSRYIDNGEPIDPTRRITVDLAI